MYTQPTQMHNIHLEGSTNVGTFDTEQDAINNMMNFSPASPGSQALLHTHPITHPPTRNFTSG